jgi:hypothetical protein
MACSTLKLVSDPASLLQLCSTLYDRSAPEIQIKINNYVSFLIKCGVAAASTVSY